MLVVAIVMVLVVVWLLVGSSESGDLLHDGKLLFGWWLFLDGWVLVVLGSSGVCGKWLPVAGKLGDVVLYISEFFMQSF